MQLNGTTVYSFRFLCFRYKTVVPLTVNIEDKLIVQSIKTVVDCIKEIEKENKINSNDA